MAASKGEDESLGDPDAAADLLAKLRFENYDCGSEWCGDASLELKHDHAQGSDAYDESVRGSDFCESIRGSDAYDDEDLDAHRRFKEVETKFTFFWKQEDVFSSLHESKFKVGGIWFTCAEQYIQYRRAKLFGSDNVAQEILKTNSPQKIEKLSKKVKRFQANSWAWHCLEMAKPANIYKYTQNKGMKEILFSTYPTVLVQADPHDRVWGIGLIKQNERAWQESTWDGLNLMGYLLTEVRDELMCKEGIIPDRKCKVYLPKLKDKLTYRLSPGDHNIY